MNTLPLPILYTFRRCPYAMRARMAIYTAKVKVETVEVSLKNKPQSLLDYSPKGTVPVLVTATGAVIDQSRDIMTWALHQADPENWLMQNNPAAQQAMTALMNKCDYEFKPLLDRYKYFDRYPELTQNEHRQNAEFFLAELEGLLTKHNFLIDDVMRLADVAIFPFLRQFAGVNGEWLATSQYRNLQRWLNCCLNTPQFTAIMAKV